MRRRLEMGGDGGAENRLLGIGAQVFDYIPRGGDKSTRAREGFGHAATDDIDLIIEPEEVYSAATLIAQHAKPMGVIDDTKAVIFLTNADNFGEFGDVAFHRVDAFDDEHTSSP